MSSASTEEVKQSLCSSLESEIDTLSQGRLVLALDKDTYELLGLEGRPSCYGSPRQRFSPSPLFPLRKFCLTSIRRHSRRDQSPRPKFQSRETRIRKDQIEITELAEYNFNFRAIGRIIDSFFFHRDWQDVRDGFRVD